MYLTILFSFLISVCAQADSLSLSKAKEIARNQSTDLKQMELKLNSASWKGLEALSGHLPQIGITASHFLSSQYGKLDIFFGGGVFETPMAYPQTDAQIEVSLLLFDGLGTINKYRAALYSYEAAQSDYDYAKFRVDENISIKFSEALAAQELAKVTDQNIATLESHLKLAHANERAGAGTRFDALRIESQLEEAKAEKVLADDNVIVARRTLYTDMGIEFDTRTLDGSLPVPDAGHIPANLTLDVSARPDVQAQLKRELASDRMDDSAAAFWFPKISIFGQKEFYKFGTFDPLVVPNDSYREASAVGLRLTWNIFDGGASWARKAQANDAYLESVQTSKRVLLTSPNEFDNWKRRYIYNTTLYFARLRTIDKSKESVRLATIAVRAGTKTHSDILDAELDLFRAKAGAIRAQVDAVESMSNLELALGRKL